MPGAVRGVPGDHWRLSFTPGIQCCLPLDAFHDMRASGLTLAAQGGATIPNLMARAGHSTSAAALLYQRTAVERGAVIAASMDAALRAVAN